MICAKQASSSLAAAGAHRRPGRANGTRTMVKVAGTRNCEQCGTLFAPRREHARFCSARCRVAWNRQNASDRTAEVTALDWSLSAMRDATERLLRKRASGGPQAFAMISEAVWWVTNVHATLGRYHPDAYNAVLAGPAAPG